MEALLLYIKSFTFTYSLIFGFVTSETNLYYDGVEDFLYYHENQHNLIYNNLELYINSPKGHFSLGGGSEIDFKHARKVYFQPLNALYTVKAVARYGKLELSVLHECGHPVGTIDKEKTALSNKYSAKTGIYLKFTGGKKL